MKIEEFCKFIKKYYSTFKEAENRQGLLLIEPICNNMVVYAMATYALAICKAKNLSPAYLECQPDCANISKSFDPTAKTLNLPKLSVFEKLSTMIKAKIIYSRLKNAEDILKITYKGMLIGDIIYDVYLSHYTVGTIATVPAEIEQIIKNSIRYNERILKLFSQNNNIKTVLVSQKIGLSQGILYRSALKTGYEVYSNQGNGAINVIYKTNPNDQVKSYEKKATTQDIKQIMNCSHEQLEDMFQYVNKYHMSGKASMDSKNAFAADSTIYKTKEEFNAKYGLDIKKKNIFVMLHAFTDFPNSHFEAMLFQDYADWFLKTLEYAKGDTSVNWIFKRHPSDFLYPTKDIDFSALFSEKFEHITFLDLHDKVNTLSLCNIADAVVTCIGSAGFELPAFAKIPPIIAGDSHYSGLGFTIEPKDKKEYFEELSRLSTITPLSDEQQRIAKAAYIFIYYLFGINMLTSNAAFVTTKELKYGGEEFFYDAMANILKNYGHEAVFEQLYNISNKLNDSTFKALRGDISELLKRTK